MKIDISSDEELDNLVICHKCHTLHRKLPIEDRSKALCRNCGTVLYHRDERLLEHGLALSLSGLIFFIVANAFPLVRIEILGHEQFISIPSMILSMVDIGYYLVALFVGYLIFIFPLMIFSIYILLFLLMKRKRGKILSKKLLVLLAEVKPWNMSDIFLISILVALVKLIGMAEIHFGISFWALLLFVAIDLYLTRYLRIGELWELRKKVYGTKKREKDARSR